MICNETATGSCIRFPDKAAGTEVLYFQKTYLSCSERTRSCFQKESTLPCPCKYNRTIQYKKTFSKNFMDTCYVSNNHVLQRTVLQSLYNMTSIFIHAASPCPHFLVIRQKELNRNNTHSLLKRNFGMYTTGQLKVNSGRFKSETYIVVTFLHSIFDQH